MTSQQENSQIESAIDRRLFLGAAGALTLAGQSALAQGAQTETKAEAKPAEGAKRLSDTIANFVTGTDKIDLTALGAFDSAVLALTPTSTSVPEHTIAWRFDSKANEMIVYANPTGETLSIGNSGLLEIHLPGIATIHSSDFTHGPTTAATTVVAASDPIDLAATTQNDATIVTTTAAVDSSDKIIATAITADVSIGPRDGGGFGLAVKLHVVDPSLPQAELAALAKEAHEKICPYSNATRGNVDVQLDVKGA